MQSAGREGLLLADPVLTASVNTTGVSWGAIFAGAACTAALAMVLMILGFGLGLSALSPWTADAGTAKALGVSGILWLGAVEIVSAGLGGYLTGRLRARWPGVHRDEIHFRDTAHGLISWAVATVAAATMLAAGAAMMLTGGMMAGAEAAATVGAGALAGQGGQEQPSAVQPGRYFGDAMLRADPAAAGFERADPTVRAEVSAILMADIAQGSLNAQDRQYLGELVARHTGLAPADADRRVVETYNRAAAATTAARNSALQAADTARKAASYSALWMFIALLLGAFFSSLMATWGGRARDAVLTERI